MQYRLVFACSFTFFTLQFLWNCLLFADWLITFRLCVSSFSGDPVFGRVFEIHFDLFQNVAYYVLVIFQLFGRCQPCLSQSISNSYMSCVVLSNGNVPTDVTALLDFHWFAYCISFFHSMAPMVGIEKNTLRLNKIQYFPYHNTAHSSSSDSVSFVSIQISTSECYSFQFSVHLFCHNVTPRTVFLATDFTKFSLSCKSAKHCFRSTLSHLEHVFCFSQQYHPVFFLKESPISPFAGFFKTSCF